MSQARELTSCDSGCAYDNHCRLGGMKCERCGGYFCPGVEGQDNLCGDCLVGVGETSWREEEESWESIGIERPKNLRKAYPQIYNSYRSMMYRCGLWKNDPYASPHLASYAANPPTVCEEWQGKGGFERFLLWSLSPNNPRPWAPGLTIDRMNNDLRLYCQSNCRWATWSEQNKNRRMTEKMRAANRANWEKALAVLAKRGRGELEL